MVAAVVGAAPAPPLADAPANARLLPRIRPVVIHELIRQLERRYVFPDSVPKIAAHLESRLRARAYDRATTPGEFGTLVTQDLIAFDRHLDVRYDIERERALLAA